MAYEFRVRWRRDGQWRASTRIYQDWTSACRKARRIAALEQVKDDTRFADMPDLAEGPTVQVREVGDWRDHDYQPNPTEYDLEGARTVHAPYSPQDDAGVPF